MAVYFIQDAFGHVKIGHSADPAKRLASLQVGNSAGLYFMRILDGGERTERWLHRRFADRAISGEWFRFHDDMLTIVPPDEIVSRKQVTTRRDVGLTLRERIRDADNVGAGIGLSAGAQLTMFVSGLPADQAAEVLDLLRSTYAANPRPASEPDAA